MEANPHPRIMDKPTCIEFQLPNDVKYTIGRYEGNGDEHLVIIKEGPQSYIKHTIEYGWIDIYNQSLLKGEDIDFSDKKILKMLILNS